MASAYLQLKQEQAKVRELQRQLVNLRPVTIQQCADIAHIALHRGFGFGPARQKRFAEAFEEAFLEYATRCLDDAKDDKSIIYTKHKMDAALKAACGEHFVPWEVRYEEGP